MKFQIYIDIHMNLQYKFKEIMTLQLGFNHFIHNYVCTMIIIPDNNSCHHWRQKLLEIRGLAQSKTKLNVAQGFTTVATHYK